MLLPATLLQNRTFKHVLAGGNLVGKTYTCLGNTMILLRKLIEFESFPGHTFFFIYQLIITHKWIDSRHGNASSAARTIENSRAHAGVFLPLAPTHCVKNT